MADLIAGNPALLVVDMQYGFVDPRARCYAPGSEALVPGIAELADRSRRAGIPVIYTREVHRPGRVDIGREADPGTGASYPGGTPDSPVPDHCVEGTREAEIVAELAPQPGDLEVVKRRYSCFLGTDLELLLGNLDVDTLLITGIDSNVCVLWTVGDAFQLDYHVRVIEDCISGTSDDEHAAAMLIMRKLVGHVVRSADVIAELDKRAGKETAVGSAA
jgi:biuret amidohydrolase